MEFTAAPDAPTAPLASVDDQTDVEDPKTADRRRRPELVRDTVEKKEPLENEFAPDLAGELDEDTPRIRRMSDLMQGVARQALLDPDDELGL
ncbi:hypothetical protein AC628_20290 [Bradyrhizobium sp. NAS96.2]|nr:hypothetical protein AC628_20290 [Bradyrhizobium sp. NAS96.2]